MNDANHYERFSKGKEARESFYGRFSTTTREDFGIPGREWSPWQLLIRLVIAFDLVFGFVRPFVMEPMHVPSSNMAPTLQPGGLASGADSGAGPLS